MIYLDNAATTYPKPEQVYAAMDYANRNMAFNSGRGSYKAARELNGIIEETRQKLVKLVKGSCEKAIFTSSVTIALNQILMGLNLSSASVVYVSPYEHNAVVRTLELIRKKSNIEVRELPIDENTLEIDIEKMCYEFSIKKPSLVCCTHISNVTGYILPIKRIFNNAKKYDAVTVLDAAQSFGLVDINMETIGADFITFAGHKSLYAPLGAAGFITNEKYVLNEYIAGGTGSDSLNLSMPDYIIDKLEPGSHNVVAIAGLRAALDNLEIEKTYAREKELSEILINKLQSIDGIKLYLPDNLENHIAVVSFNIKGFSADEVGTILDEDFDIAVRTGYHCAPFIHKWLHNEAYAGTVRASIGRYTSEEDIDKLVEALEEIL